MPRLRRVAKTLPRWADLVLTSAMREGPVPPPYLGWVVPAAPPQQVDQVQMSRMRDRLVPPPPQQWVAPAAPFRQVGPKAPMVLPWQLTAAGHIHRGHTHCHCGPLQIGSGQHHQYGMHHGCCLPCHCHFYTSYSGCPESTDHSVHREKRSMNRTHRWQRRCSRIDRCSDVSGRSALPCPALHRQTPVGGSRLQRTISPRSAKGGSHRAKEASAGSSLPKHLSMLRTQPHHFKESSDPPSN